MSVTLTLPLRIKTSSMQYRPGGMAVFVSLGYDPEKNTTDFSL